MTANDPIHPYNLKVKACREMGVGAGVAALALNRLLDAGEARLDERRRVAAVN